MCLKIGSRFYSKKCHYTVNESSLKIRFIGVRLLMLRHRLKSDASSSACQMVKTSHIIVPRHSPPGWLWTCFSCWGLKIPLQVTAVALKQKTYPGHPKILRKKSDAIQKRWGFSLFNHLAKIWLRFTLECDDVKQQSLTPRELRDQWWIRNHSQQTNPCVFFGFGLPSKWVNSKLTNLYSNF